MPHRRYIAAAFAAACLALTALAPAPASAATGAEAYAWALQHVRARVAYQFYPSPTPVARIDQNRCLPTNVPAWGWWACYQIGAGVSRLTGRYETWAGGLTVFTSSTGVTGFEGSGVLAWRQVG